MTMRPLTDEYGNPVPNTTLEQARAAVLARVADSLGLDMLPEVVVGTGGRGVVPTVARCLDALYCLDGGLTVGQWCALRTLLTTLLDHLDGNLDGEGLGGVLPLYHIEPRRPGTVQ